MIAFFLLAMMVLPEVGFVRLKDVLRFIPVSKSTWFAWIQQGRAPAPMKLGPRVSAWRAEDIRELIDKLSNGGAS